MAPCGSFRFGLLTLLGIQLIRFERLLERLNAPIQLQLELLDHRVHDGAQCT